MKKFSRLALVILMVATFNITPEKVYAKENDLSCKTDDNEVIFSHGKPAIQDSKKSKKKLEELSKRKKQIEQKNEDIKKLEKALEENNKEVEKTNKTLARLYCGKAYLHILSKQYDQATAALEKSLDYLKKKRKESDSKEIQKKIEPTKKKISDLKKNKKPKEQKPVNKSGSKSW